jgi:hypothetical protein
MNEALIQIGFLFTGKTTYIGIFQFFMYAVRVHMKHIEFSLSMHLKIKELLTIG